MAGSYLVRGMLVGVGAGLAAALFAYLFGEPSLDLAIGFEQHASHAAHDAEPELFSRAVQSTIGLLTGLVVVGAAIGGVFGLVVAYAQGRLGRLSPRATAAVIAAAGFLVIGLMPQLKYPANPPAVGSADSIGSRTALFFLLLALSILVAVAALGLGRRLLGRFGVWNATVLGLASYFVAMAIVMQVLPAIDEVPNGFSATLLWQFRLATIGIQAVLWAALGLGFGALTERSLSRSLQPAVDRARG